MKLIKTEDSAGQILCHDITQIIKGVTKGARFKKGHIITPEDIPVLLSLGKDNIYIWENDESKLHENDAAEILRSICQGENMHATEPSEGKIELVADIDGLLMINLEKLRAVNSLGDMMIATRMSGFPVKKGDKICGTRIIPLVIDKKKMIQAQAVAGTKPILELLPIKAKKYGIVTTGNEVFHGRIADTFTPVLVEKMDEYGGEMIGHKICDDNHERITASILELLGSGAELVLCTGGMSVDPDDRTPLAIRNTGARVVSYGAPVLPGAMFFVSYMPDGRPVCGVPGCAMYAKKTILDIVLPRLLADVPVTFEWLAGLGNGGLCLNCPECHYPNCTFGKGV